MLGEGCGNSQNIQQKDMHIFSDKRYLIYFKPQVPGGFQSPQYGEDSTQLLGHVNKCYIKHYLKFTRMAKLPSIYIPLQFKFPWFSRGHKTRKWKDGKLEEKKSNVKSTRVQ